jgi:hypothetical protein
MIRYSGLTALILSIAGPAVAHHGFGSFDVTRDLEITGTITGLDFVNPHAWLYLDVTGDDGTVAPFRCELRPATVLRRAGWSEDMFVVGETVSIEGSPDREDPNACYISTLVLADGSRLDRYGQRNAASAPNAAPRSDRLPRLPTGEPNISGDWAEEQYVMTDPRGQSGAFVPISVARGVGTGDVPEGYVALEGARNDTDTGLFGPLLDYLRVLVGADTFGDPTSAVVFTPLGERTARDAMQDADFDWRCGATDILSHWGRVEGLINRITQKQDTITLEYGHLGFARTIHMNVDEHPDDIDPSRTGHSIGRWENDVLVVDTIGVSPGPSWPPLFHGEQMHVVEMFSLDPDTMALRREFVAEDPEHWIGEFRHADVVYPSETPYVADRCEELPFDD